MFVNVMHSDVQANSSNILLPDLLNLGTQNALLVQQGKLDKYLSNLVWLCKIKASLCQLPSKLKHTNGTVCVCAQMPACMHVHGCLKTL